MSVELAELALKTMVSLAHAKVDPEMALKMVSAYIPTLDYETQRGPNVAHSHQEFEAPSLPSEEEVKGNDRALDANDKLFLAYLDHNAATLKMVADEIEKARTLCLEGDKIAAMLSMHNIDYLAGRIHKTSVLAHHHLHPFYCEGANDVGDGGTGSDDDETETTTTTKTFTFDLSDLIKGMKSKAESSEEPGAEPTARDKADAIMAALFGGLSRTRP